MAENDLSQSNMTNMDPAMELLIFTKMIPCPGVGILKMIPCLAARSHTEKCMSAPLLPGYRLMNCEQSYLKELLAATASSVCI